MQNFKRFSGLLLTFLAIAVFQFLDETAFSLPNSTAFLTIFVMLSAFSGGTRIGLVSAAAAWLYSTVHFSENHFLQFPRIDLIRVISFAFVYPLHAIVTGVLKARLLEKVESEKKLQAKLVASAKLSSLGEMAGGIAHEINNPLTIIQMRAGQMVEAGERGSLDTATAIETGKKIVMVSSRISEIIKGLRFFSRDGANDPIQNVTAQTIILDTLCFCSEKFKASGILLDVAMPSVPLYLECRPTQISQVLLNLLNNAFDAVQKLEQKWANIELVDRNESIEISVTDSGPGITHEIQDKIMQPFFTTKEIGSGTGLGLSVSQGIIASHRGKLYIDQSSDHTRFVIAIPKVCLNKECSPAFGPMES